MNKNDLESIYNDLVDGLNSVPDNNPIEALEYSKEVAQAALDVIMAILDFGLKEEE
ncbi:hypothetical protein [Limosilactobacillus reuteri]|uniref:hypothetical protein n=1 Tax=Limosilactobacillus reuteri TaxID=1598 RepID=UPI0014048498|nr:hypothetical protein [Limosilactobacillus reuteri]